MLSAKSRVIITLLKAVSSYSVIRKNSLLAALTRDVFEECFRDYLPPEYVDDISRDANSNRVSLWPAFSFGMNLEGNLSIDVGGVMFAAFMRQEISEDDAHIVKEVRMRTIAGYKAALYATNVVFADRFQRSVADDLVLQEALDKLKAYRAAPTEEQRDLKKGSLKMAPEMCAHTLAAHMGVKNTYRIQDLPDGQGQHLQVFSGVQKKVLCTVLCFEKKMTIVVND